MTINEHHPDVQKARELACVAHGDLAGLPYITHVARVAARVAYCGPAAEAVAWLHDVVEDCDVTMDDIRALFPPEIAAGVDAMTQRPDEPLESYWTRVASNRLAFIVKLHGDMPDDNNPDRPGNGDEERSAKRRNKYADAINFFFDQIDPHPTLFVKPDSYKDGHRTF